ncbi:MAG: bifunctional diaminohydroxyphosphoribosylaminopyrimidine deaminase/5-amino-6-(5-phosphoribosylamino)uracil reductase RibD, partial [Cyanobacteria bacterium P01_G01_bin.38]
IHRVQHRRPFGILKYAMTLDGKIATDSGHSAWVTSPESRQRVHQLRGICDAVIVGGNTVRRDNPNLTTHGVSLSLSGLAHPARNPLRVVMSRQLNLPMQANLWNAQIAQTVVFTDKRLADQTVRSHLETQGVEVVALPNLTPDAVMENLYGRGLLNVLWECGGTLAAAAIAQGAVQKVWAFVAPKLIGGRQGMSPIGNLGLTQMTQAIALKDPKLEQTGSDWLIQGYLASTPTAT